MKTLSFSLIIAASLTLGLMNLQSQAPATGRSPVEALQTLKASNQKVLERQTATLVKLDEMQKEAQQLRFMAARN